MLLFASLFVAKLAFERCLEMKSTFFLMAGSLNESLDQLYGWISRSAESLGLEGFGGAAAGGSGASGASGSQPPRTAAASNNGGIANNSRSGFGSNGFLVPSPVSSAWHSCSDVSEGLGSWNLVLLPAMTVMVSCVEDTFDRISMQANRLCRRSGSHSINTRDIQSAVRLVFPGELSRHAVSEGCKAVINHKQSGGGRMAAQAQADDEELAEEAEAEEGDDE
ncbi:Histone H2B.5 [Symbiodinium microadriaticum]|uniref:Histone H2B.5 n=1 Tax=Symbiodinium microadriaticum TaxID=2951 RepID=A0A1Q9E0Y6_SYMMI|nr:Histone H2B.5 [Symbiodinium microadriaticum]CAE7367929.1 unnamed protein product [Symbiodinium sp. KB8]